MKYARIIDWVAVDVVDAPPATLFTPEIAAQFTVVPDIEQGSVLLPVLVNETPTADRAWQPPRTYLMEYQPGKWQYAQRDVGPAAVFAAAPAQRYITTLAFYSRFTDAEGVTFDLASLGATQGAAALRRYLKKVDLAEYIDLDRADTRAGVQALESAGLIAAGRAAQILDAPIQPHEIYRGITHG